jgi:hypothetical protein
VKKVFRILILLVLAACQQKQAPYDHAVDQEKSPLLVIDRPAAVVFRPGAGIPGIEEESWENYLKKILSPWKVEIIHSSGKEFEFVKSNGDKVLINTGKFREHYDLILFNARNNPLPVSFDDLGRSILSYFLNESPAKESSLLIQENIPEPEKDTMREKTGRSVNWRKSLPVIPIQVPDTASDFHHRKIDGITWVENRVDTRRILTVTFENDLITYANTDRYFTNGIAFSLQAPWLGNSPLSRLMIPYRHSSNSQYELSLVQNMYTPTDTRVAPKLDDDRPYASYLSLGYKRITRDPFRKLRLTTEIISGYIGPYSPGSYLQTVVHETFPTNDKPLGWETQIRTDLLLNYNLSIEKAILDQGNLLVAGNASAEAGSLHTNFGTGFIAILGRHEPYFGWTCKANHQKYQYYFFIKAEGKLIGFDATLQGGLLDRKNTFFMKSDEITRFTGKAEVGFRVTYKDTGLELAQHYLTPEYHGGMFHKWGRISLLIKL